MLTKDIGNIVASLPRYVPLFGLTVIPRSPNTGWLLAVIHIYHYGIVGVMRSLLAVVSRMSMLPQVKVVLLIVSLLSASSSVFADAFFLPKTVKVRVPVTGGVPINANIINIDMNKNIHNHHFDSMNRRKGGRVRVRGGGGQQDSSTSTSASALKMTSSLDPTSMVTPLLFNSAPLNSSLLIYTLANAGEQ